MFCPSSKVILKLLLSSTEGDIELGLNYLGQRDFSFVKNFLRENSLTEKLERQSNQKFFVKCKGYIIICGWYYIEAYETLTYTSTFVTGYKYIEI